MPVRLRRVAALLLTCACLSATAACDGSAGAASGTDPHASATYLALGDSVPFGYRAGAGADYETASDFVGYPELVGRKLHLDVVNATCPGETTTSFTDVTAQSNGCENTLRTTAGYRTAYPLHVRYDSARQSQLDFALSTLKRTKDVSLVTLQLGANDAFLCQQTTADRCASEIVTVAESVQSNLIRILSALRDRGGYHGRIVVVTYYAMNYATAEAAGIQVLNSAMAAAATVNHAEVASGFDAFAPAAKASGGDAVAAGLVRPGDVHPTAEGQQLLAEAVERAVSG